jgi:predicted alpha/beta superfamily hydrolase
MYKVTEMKAGGRDAALMLSGDKKAPLLFTVSDHEDREKFLDDLGGADVNILSVSGVNWEDELTPWPADKIMKKTPDFTGHADGFLREITDVIISDAEESGALEPDEVWIGGYSLMGLFSAYAVFRTDFFDRMFSASGSLWFDGFVDFTRENEISKDLRQAYFSLGDREANAKNSRMARVADCTDAVTSEFEKSVGDVFFEYNQGGHFNDPEGRQAKAVKKLCEGYEKEIGAR